MNLEKTLAGRFDKEEVCAYVQNDTTAFKQLIRLALQVKTHNSWRAAWVLNHAMLTNDERLTPYLSKIIEITPQGSHGLQRELLKILLKLSPSEDQEGLVFDLAVTIWQDISHAPALRVTAFKHIIKIAKKHPDIQNEIPFLTQTHYIDSLSPGIKRSVEKMLK